MSRRHASVARIALFVLPFSFFVVVSSSAQWPEFRGPGGQGHAAVGPVPLEWGETKNVAWKVPIRGRGWSSPVISDERVWMTTSVAEARGASLRAVAFDAATGRELLNVEVFKLSDGNLKNPKNS